MRQATPPAFSTEKNATTKPGSLWRNSAILVPFVTPISERIAAASSI
jgi:hypothetical protein